MIKTTRSIGNCFVRHKIFAFQADYSKGEENPFLSRAHQQSKKKKKKKTLRKPNSDFVPVYF